MRRLLISVVALCLGVVIGCRHNHTSGVCDCVDRGLHGHVPHDSHGAVEVHREMPKGN